MHAISGGSNPDGAPQMATYTADSSGNLTTKSAYENMPTTLVVSPSTLAMSPSGKLLAVAGNEGLEVFHFNGSSPITHYTGLLSTHSFTPTTPSPGLMFWDNSNHLYAMSPDGDQKLRVFTITPTSATLAAGSPISVARVQNIAVLPK
jgi:6-phosphogluconolactonase (cycloisomerase 2 family)